MCLVYFVFCVLPRRPILFGLRKINISQLQLSAAKKKRYGFLCICDVNVIHFTHCELTVAASSLLRSSTLFSLCHPLIPSHIHTHTLSSLHPTPHLPALPILLHYKVGYVKLWAVSVIVVVAVAVSSIINYVIHDLFPH